MSEKSFRKRFWADLFGADDNAEPAPILDYQAYRLRDRFWFELLGTPLPTEPHYSVARSAHQPAASAWQFWSGPTGGAVFATATAVGTVRGGLALEAAGLNGLVVVTASPLAVIAVVLGFRTIAGMAAARKSTGLHENGEDQSPDDSAPR